MTELNQPLLEAVAQHHQREGIFAQMGSQGVTIRMGEASLVLAAGIFLREDKGDSFIVEAEFRLRLWPPEWGSIVQYHAGWAELEAGALAQTIHGWIDGVWPVIAALYDPEAMRRLPVPVKLTTITGDAHPVEWRVLVGPPIAKCQVGMLTAVEAEAAHTPPFTLLAGALADAVNQRRLKPDGVPCWGHLYASRVNRQPGFHEATLREEPWPEAVEGLLRLNWPDSDAFMSVRQFYVIQTDANDLAAQPDTASGRQPKPSLIRHFLTRREG